MKAIMDEVESIVAKYGGSCYECGPIDPDHVPFADYWTLPGQRICYQRRIDEMTRGGFARFEPRHRGLVVQNLCRTCALEMLRQEMIETLRFDDEPWSLARIGGVAGLRHRFTRAVSGSGTTRRSSQVRSVPQA